MIVWSKLASYLFYINLQHLSGQTCFMQMYIVLLQQSKTPQRSCMLRIYAQILTWQTQTLLVARGKCLMETDLTNKLWLSERWTHMTAVWTRGPLRRTNSSSASIQPVTLFTFTSASRSQVPYSTSSWWHHVLRSWASHFTDAWLSVWSGLILSVSSCESQCQRLKWFIKSDGLNRMCRPQFLVEIRKRSLFSRGENI